MSLLLAPASFTAAATTDSRDAARPAATAKSSELQRRFDAALKLASQKRTPEAIEQFRKLSEQYPNVPELQNNLAVLYAERGELDKAQAALESALHGRSSYDTIYRNLGSLNSRRAAKAYAQALSLDASKAAAPALVLLTELGEAWDPAANLARDEVASAVIGPALLPNSGLLASTPPPPPASTSVTQRSSSGAVAVTPPAPAPTSAASNKPAPAASTAPVVVAAAPKVLPVPAPPPAVKPAAAPVASAVAASVPRPASVPAVVVAAASKPAIAAAPVASAAASAVAATKPAVVATVTPAAPLEKPRDTAGDEVNIRKAVQAWASAWESRNMAAYLAAYAPGFKGGEASPTAWQAARRVRILGKTSIDVKVSSVVVSMSRTQASATFTQAYTADQLKLVSRKTLVFELRDGRWLITRESATTSRA